MIDPYKEIGEMLESSIGYFKGISEQVGIP